MIRNLADSWGLELRETLPANVGEAYVSSYGVPPPKALDDLESAAEAVAYVYACVGAVAAKVAEVPWQLRDAQGQRVENHPVLELLEHPHPRYTGGQLREAIVYHLLLAGNCYLQKLIDPNQPYPVGLWPLIPPSRVRVVPGERKLILGYLFINQKGEKIPLEADEVIHVRLFHPRNAFYGLSPLQALMDELITDIYAVRYNKKFFEQGARPGGIIYGRYLTPQAIEKNREEWNRLHQGVGRAHAVAFLSGDLTYQAIGLSQAEMEFLEGRRFTKEQIRALYRVPAEVLGDTKGSSYSGMAAAFEHLYLDVVIPLAQYIGEVLAQGLLRDTGLRLLPDFEQVRSLTAVVEQRARTSERMLRAGFSLNEIREMIWGLGGIGPEGDKRYVPANLLPM